MALAVRAAVRPLWLPHRALPPRQCVNTFLYHFPSPQATISTAFRRISLTSLPSYRRCLHFRSQGLRFRNTSVGSESDLEDSKRESDSETKRSRNEKKREARLAVRWGMELASFSTPQIKRILSAASLEQEVFEALMLVKRLGSDVREGKRRQFSYIGKLLRDAKPDLLGALIQATKDGDQSMLQALSSSSKRGDENNDADNDGEEVYQSESEEDDEESPGFVTLANKWYGGLLNKDIKISNEVYSIHLEFDRQELRRLVRRVQSLRDAKACMEEETAAGNAGLVAAERSLTRFLHSLAKQTSTEGNLTL